MKYIYEDPRVRKRILEGGTIGIQYVCSNGLFMPEEYQPKPLMGYERLFLADKENDNDDV